jgi:hypothetical protein
MEWTQESVIDLANFIKKEIIWDPRNPMFFNKVKKQDARGELENFEKVLQTNVRITTCQ